MIDFRAELQNLWLMAQAIFLVAVTTGLHRGWVLPGLDSVFQPTRVDHECRPYELGWLL